MEERTLSSPAWILKTLVQDSTPAVLALTGGRLSLTTAEGPVFDVPLSEVRDIKWPWLQMGLGVRFTVKDKRYPITFMKPAGAATATDALLLGGPWALELGAESIAGLMQLGKQKQVAKNWRTVLDNTHQNG